MYPSFPISWQMAWQTVHHVSASPPCHPGRSDFPSPVGDHSFPMPSSSRRGGLSAHPHTPLTNAVYCMLDTAVSFPHSSGSASYRGTRTLPAMTESPFAPPRCYLLGRNVNRSLGQRYPTRFALTGSCARPRSSVSLCSRSDSQSLPVAVSLGWK
jgi:hypothetical protein